ILFPVDSPYYRFERLGPPLAGHFFFDLVHQVSARGGARGGAFPSANVSGAVIVWLVAWRHQPRLAALLSPCVLGLIVGTVYGRFPFCRGGPGGGGRPLPFFAIQGGLWSRSGASWPPRRRQPGRASITV